MSEESENLLGPNAKQKDVLELLNLLQYKHVARSPKIPNVSSVTNHFFWFEDDKYRSWSGVELMLFTRNKRLYVTTHTNASRSYFDTEHQNKTIRLLKKYFGGEFVTDNGKGRYLVKTAQSPEPAASGCHIAFNRFGSNMIRPLVYFGRRKFHNLDSDEISHVHRVDIANPRFTSNAMILPYIMSVAEEYWKSTFIAMLRYSSSKLNAIKDLPKLSPIAISQISTGEKTVEQAISEPLSFIGISKVCENFSKIDKKLNFAGLLMKPYGRRKTNLYKMLDDLANIRNGIIHNAGSDYFLTDLEIRVAFRSVSDAVEICYRDLTAKRHWPFIKNFNLRVLEKNVKLPKSQD